MSIHLALPTALGCAWHRRVGSGDLLSAPSCRLINVSILTFLLVPPRSSSTTETTYAEEVPLVHSSASRPFSVLSHARPMKSVGCGCGGVAVTVAKNTADAYLKKEGELSAASRHFNGTGGAEEKKKNAGCCIQ